MSQSLADACSTSSLGNGADVITGLPETDDTDGVDSILTRVGVLLITLETVDAGWFIAETGVPGRVLGVTITYLGVVVAGTAAVAAVRGTVRRAEGRVIVGITRDC